MIMKQNTNATGTDKMSRAIVMIGGPGSGKTFIRNRDFGDMDVLDSDQFKVTHPDYDPKDPGALHAWSTVQLTRAFFAKIATGEDFVLDGTGTSVERYATWMTQMSTAGYKVEIVYVKTTMAVALERNRNRERVVPEHIVREKHAVVATSFDILSGYADTITVINN